MTTQRSPITKRVTACGLAVLLAASMLVTSTGLRGADLSDLPRANPEDVGMSSARLDRVSAMMQRYIDEELLAGTVTLIARHGKVVHLEAQGLRDKESDQLMTAEVHFYDHVDDKADRDGRVDDPVRRRTIPS